MRREVISPFEDLGEPVPVPAHPAPPTGDLDRIVEAVNTPAAAGV